MPFTIYQALFLWSSQAALERLGEHKERIKEYNGSEIK